MIKEPFVYRVEDVKTNNLADVNAKTLPTQLFNAK